MALPGEGYVMGGAVLVLVVLVSVMVANMYNDGDKGATSVPATSVAAQQENQEGSSLPVGFSIMITIIAVVVLISLMKSGKVL